MARGIDVGAGYAVAPGYSVYAEYLWNDQTQNANNFVTGAVGTAARCERLTTTSRARAS